MCRACRTIALLSWLGVTCGCAEAGMWIVLDTVAGDAPFEQVRQIEVTVLREGKTIESYRGPFVGGEVELEPVPRADNLLLRVEGLTLEAEVVASGRAQPEMPEREGACCLHMCFCSAPVVEAGDCQCGSDRCRDTCEPEE